MRNTLSLLAIAAVASWGAINLGCAPGEAPPASTSSSVAVPAATQIAFNVEGMH
jgi:hypothetical protein